MWYILDNSIIIGHASLHSQEFQDKNKLWHLRLWHASNRYLIELAKQGLIGIDKFNKL